MSGAQNRGSKRNRRERDKMNANENNTGKSVQNTRALSPPLGRIARRSPAISGTAQATRPSPIVHVMSTRVGLGLNIMVHLRSMQFFDGLQESLEFATRMPVDKTTEKVPLGRVYHHLRSTRLDSGTCETCHLAEQYATLRPSQPNQQLPSQNLTPSAEQTLRFVAS
jgi:hypothetical protein